MTNLRPLLTGTSLQIFARIFTAVCTVIVYGYLARQIDTVGFGKLTFYLSVFVMLDSLVDFGVVQATLRQISLQPERETYWLTQGVALRIKLGALGMAAVFAVCWFYADSFALLGSFALLHFLTLALSIWGAHFQRRLHYRPLVSGRISGMLLTIIACVVFIQFSVSSWEWYLAAFLGGLSAAHLLVFFLAQPGLPKIVKNAASAELFHIAWPLGLVLLAQQIYFSAGNFFVRGLQGDGELHLYTLPFRCFAIALMVPQYLTATALPLLTQYGKNNLAEFRKLYRLLIKILLWLGIPLFLFTVIFAQDILSILFGAQFVQAERVLQWLAVAGLAIVLGSVGMTCLLALGKQKQMLVIVFTAAFAAIPLHYLLTRYYGVEGAALATACIEILVAVWSLNSLAKSA